MFPRGLSHSTCNHIFRTSRQCGPFYNILVSFGLVALPGLESIVTMGNCALVNFGPNLCPR